MKLLGKDITPSKVMAFVGERLAARGLSSPGEELSTQSGVEPRVDPLSFNLQALESNADATQGLPLETHRDGLAGSAVVLAKRLFRKAGQVFINEALGRQRVFNGHVRDSYAQLAAEVIRLRKRIDELEQEVPSPPRAKASGPMEQRGEEGQGEGPVPLKKPKPPPRPKPAPPSAPRPPPRNTRRGK